MRCFFSGPEASGDRQASVDARWKPEDLLETWSFLNRVGEGMVESKEKGGGGGREHVIQQYIMHYHSTWAKNGT